MMESVKKAFTLGVKAVKLFYVIAAFNIITNIVNLLVIPAPASAEMTFGRSLLVIAVTIVASLLAIFLTAGVLVHIRELIKAGSTSLASFVNDAKKYFLPLLAILLIILLAFLVVGILLSLILAFIPDALKILLMIIALVALAIFIVMSPYALVGSELGVVESIKRAVLMGKKNFFKILGIVAIMFGVAIVVMIAASVITGLLSFILRPIASLVAGIVMAVANAIMIILVNIAYMDFYLKSAETAQESIQS